MHLEITPQQRLLLSEPFLTGAILPQTHKTISTLQSTTQPLCREVLASDPRLLRAGDDDDPTFSLDLICYYFLPAIRPELLAYYADDGPKLKDLPHVNLSMLDTHLSRLFVAFAAGNSWFSRGCRVRKKEKGGERRN